jgi:hypothetical protein
MISSARKPLRGMRLSLVERDPSLASASTDPWG